MKAVIVGLWLFVCSQFLAGPVLAVPIIFDFSSSALADGLYPELNLSTSGLQVRILATDENDQLQEVSKLGSGLGVYSGGSDSKVIDGSGYDERLQFIFEDSVQLLRVLFSLVESGDDFSLAVDGSLRQAAAIPGTGLVDFHTSGGRFDFGVTGSNDDYRIRQLTVDLATPVPEPAGLMLLLLGFAGLAGWLRWPRNC